MINIWEYADCKKVRIIDNEDRVWEGNVVDIEDGEEFVEEGEEIPEDSIVLATNGQHVCFFASEIKKVIKLA